MADRFIWLNIVSNRSDDALKGRVFWAMEFDTEDGALDDARSYPCPGRVNGYVHYVETIKVKIGSGFNLVEMDDADRRDFMTGEDPPIRSLHHMASFGRAAE